MMNVMEFLRVLASGNTQGRQMEVGKRGRRVWAANPVMGKLYVNIRNDSLMVSKGGSQIQA